MKPCTRHLQRIDATHTHKQCNSLNPTHPCAFAQLQEVTGIREADDLADLFLHFEERIFDLVKEINICSSYMFIKIAELLLLTFFIFTGSMLPLTPTFGHSLQLLVHIFADESIEEVKQEISTLQDTQTKIESSSRQTNKHKEAVLNTKRMLLSADELSKKSMGNHAMLAKIESLVDDLDQVISVNRPDTVKGLTSEPIMKRLGMIEMYIRNQLAAKGKRAAVGGKPFRTQKGASFGKESKANATLHKKLVSDDIFNEDWSEEDSDPNDGAGIFPHSWQLTSKIVQRHFRNKNRHRYKRCVSGRVG